ncbi:unnamed protein product [Caenorhabditis bovis]|uniref:Rho-GAP domain-containing protein n=1 Tax=Caenorhabditis bovis TaxID=2654633 RepID=A0A8S1F2M5_9PELO|nr:unnamed protein product [Caenorhabditis bovis]
MMEPHNLAICFGPTLLPIPEGKDQVFYHNYVNELVRNLIIHADEVFPRDIPGPIYDKYAMQRPDDGHFTEENDLVSEDDDVTDKTPNMRNMYGSTYESADRGMIPSPMLCHTNTTSSQANTNGASPHENDFPPMPSSRSSNRSEQSKDESLPPLLRTEMPHRIANELNNIFKNSDSAGVTSMLRHSHVETHEERDYVSPPALLSSQYAASCSISPIGGGSSGKQRDYQEIDDVVDARDARDALYAPMIKQRATTLPASSNGGSLSDMSVVSAGAASTGPKNASLILSILRVLDQYRQLSTISSRH